MDAIGTRRCDAMHTGGPAYGPAVVGRLAEVLAAHVGPDRAIRVPDLVAEAGLSGSPLRAAYAALDGERWCLGKTRDGLFVARSADEAAELTRYLDAHARVVLARVDRRRGWDFAGAPIR